MSRSPARLASLATLAVLACSAPGPRAVALGEEWMATPAAVELPDQEWLGVGSGFAAAEGLLAQRLGSQLRTVEAQGGLEGFPGLSRYVGRLTARPAFRKAHADQMAHWSAADAREAAV